MRIIAIKQEAGACCGESQVVFPSSEKYFEGHFPYAPILPGVVLVDAAMEIAATVVKQPLRWVKLANVKFCNVVLPDQEICFAFKISPENNDGALLRLSGRWTRGDEKIADLQGVVTGERGGNGAS